MLPNVDRRSPRDRRLWKLPSLCNIEAIVDLGLSGSRSRDLRYSLKTKQWYSDVLLKLLEPTTSCGSHPIIDQLSLTTTHTAFGINFNPSEI